MRVTGSTIEQLEKDKTKGKCDKWRLWLSTEQGRKSRRFTGTWTQAQAALADFRQEYEDKLPEAGTLASYMAVWSGYRERMGELSSGTLANDRRNVNAISRSPLASMELTRIRPQDCRDALAWIKEHPVKADVLSNTTMNKIYVTLNAVLGQAYDDGLIAANPMQRVKAPKPDTQERHALDKNEVQALLEALGGLDLDGRVMSLYIMLYAGLRRSESLALEPRDIRGGMIHVHQAICERNGKIGATKTPAAVRRVPCPRPLLEKVDEYGEIRAALGYADSRTLCVNSRGGILRPQYVQRWWAGDSTHKAVREAVGFPELDLHELRHTNLTMMARHMTIYDLKTYAGWSSIEPARIYIHDDLDAVAQAVNEVWG